MFMESKAESKQRVFCATCEQPCCRFGKHRNGLLRFRCSQCKRMHMRRLTRLTNAFSKKWENLWAAYCLHFAYYNFCRLHKTIRVTPAMEAGIADHVWELSELLA